MSKIGLMQVVDRAQQDKEFMERVKVDPAKSAKEIGIELDADEIRLLKYREGTGQSVLEDRVNEYTDYLKTLLKWHLMKSSR